MTVDEREEMREQINAELDKVCRLARERYGDDFWSIYRMLRKSLESSGYELDDALGVFAVRLAEQAVDPHCASCDGHACEDVG